MKPLLDRLRANTGRLVSMMLFAIGVIVFGTFAIVSGAGERETRPELFNALIGTRG